MNKNKVTDEEIAFLKEQFDKIEEEKKIILQKKRILLKKYNIDQTTYYRRINELKK